MYSTGGGVCAMRSIAASSRSPSPGVVETPADALTAPGSEPCWCLRAAAQRDLASASGTPDRAAPAAIYAAQVRHSADAGRRCGWDAVSKGADMVIVDQVMLACALLGVPSLVSMFRRTRR
jgi:hypothetical protein